MKFKQVRMNATINIVAGGASWFVKMDIFFHLYNFSPQKIRDSNKYFASMIPENFCVWIKNFIHEVRKPWDTITYIRILVNSVSFGSAYSKHVPCDPGADIGNSMRAKGTTYRKRSRHLTFICLTYFWFLVGSKIRKTRRFCPVSVQHVFTVGSFHWR